MTPVPFPFRMITCPQWGAKQPKGGTTSIIRIGKSARVIFHHTAGHHPEISLPNNESDEEAMLYARRIQAAHMAPGGLGAPNGGIDSGHNLLICRGGQILQGRWLTVTAIQNGGMVQSAHCIGQNDQIGIEHEHLGLEPMTSAQRDASARAMAWIAWHYGRRVCLPVYPHNRYFNTACPANLASEMVHIETLANQILAGV